MPHLLAGDLEIEYASTGSGPEALVFVHGNFASWRWWSPVLDRLPAGMVAYAPVLRGCGATSGGSGDYSIRRLALDLEAFVDALPLRRFHLVGHSLGGAVALELALAIPRRVRSLTLVAPAPADGLVTLRRGDSRLARALRSIDPEHPPSVALFCAMQSASRAFGFHYLQLRGAIRDMIPKPDPSAPALSELVRDAYRISPRAAVGFLQALHRYDATARLASLRRPTLVVAGGRDRIVPAESLERMAAALPRAELVTWPEAGHAPQLEQSDAFAELLFAFVRRHGPLVSWRNLAARLFEG